MVSGVKRSFEQVISSDYALFGETSGVLQINQSLKFVCGVICSGWPSFALEALARGWNIKFLCCKDNEWSNYYKIWFPNTTIMLLNDIPSPALMQQGIQLWFSDVDPPRLLSLWDSDALVIITRRRARHLTNGNWRMLRLTLDHSSSGGVTDGSWDFHVYVKASLQDFTLSPSRTSGRNLQSILNSLMPGRPCAAPPKVDILQHPIVIPQRANTYHCDGLLPWTARTAFITSPSVFSPTKWVRRRLSARELLHIVDIPDVIASALSSSHHDVLGKDTTLLPMKVVLSLLNSLPLEQFASTSPSPPPKRQCLSVTFSSPSALSPATTVEVPSLPLVDVAPPPIESSPVDEAKRNLKATKADDAPVPEYLWDRAIVNDSDPRYTLVVGHLSHLRSFALRWWKRHLTREFITWFRHSHRSCTTSQAALRDRAAGVDCLSRAANSTWWEWKDRSRPFFWRWPAHYRAVIRDGLRLWCRGPLPRWRVPQRHEMDPVLRAKIRAKLLKVRLLRYILPGPVLSLTSYFAVPKGDNDIRMVYDGTKSGLNAILWAPWFPLPTIELHLRSVVPGTYMGDIDIGDMFLNFMLHSSIQTAAGVDLTPYFPEELDMSHRRYLWETWGRCAMGFKPSPYQAVQGVLHAEERIRGDPKDPTNVFRWDVIQLNLPGSASYDPSLPWVCKIRLSDGRIACDLIIYVDDVRTMGGSFEECRAASRRAASVLNFLGLQDAPRKRRDPSLTPGAWSGSIILADSDTVDVIVSQERWDKARNMVQWMADSIAQGCTIEYKPLESYRGFLIYLCRTYPAINPYLKGIHLSLDSWRPWRKDDGWRMTLREMRVAMLEKGEGVLEGSLKAPPSVRWVPRFPNDVKALLELFSHDTPPPPPRRQIRPRRTASAVYQFGDASGQGYGSSLLIGDKIHYRHGQWNNAHSQESSNFRELANLIYAIEDAYKNQLLEDVELFFFTDNSTAESVFFKGTSSSEKLFDLILRLRKLQMFGCFVLHVIHISGKRMIAQGTDGLSRGITCAGVMEGEDFKFFVPLHLSALERQGSSLETWVNSWLGENSRWLKPEDWFTNGHTSNNCVWTPPPAAADAALEQLGQSIHKRPHHMHVVLVPRLMTYRWRKLLGKICDLVFTVPLGADSWSDTNFEPLVVGIYFPLSRHEPWRLKGTPLLERAERALRDLPAPSPRWGRIKRGSLTACRQAWCGRCYVALDKGEFPIALPTDEDGVVTADPKELNRYLCGRDGDNLITPFQCDLCHFVNLTGRRPNNGDGKDLFLLKSIRRAQLDALWATEPTTVAKNLAELRRGANIASALGCKDGMFRSMGPYPIEDTFGMGPAVVMLQLSLRSGINAKHVQFNTIRKFRGAYSNVYHASTAALSGSTMASGTRKMEVTNCPTYSAWFSRFAKGCHKRMGDVVCPDRAISIDIMLEIYRQLDKEWEDASFNKYYVALEGAYYIIAYCCALRGEEIGKADLGGIAKHFEESGRAKPPHVVVALLGRFKGMSGIGYHVMPLVTRTRSGLEPRKWIGRLLHFHKERGVTNGPFFRQDNGESLKAADMSDTFYRRLGFVQYFRPDLLSREVEVEDVYGISRSFRRGSTSRATDRGIPTEVIEANSRWRKEERARSMQASLSMVEHYTDVELTLNQLLRYSADM